MGLTSRQAAVFAPQQMFARDFVELPLAEERQSARFMVRLR
jgi:hypothetical protein